MQICRGWYDLLKEGRSSAIDLTANHFALLRYGAVDGEPNQYHPFGYAVVGGACSKNPYVRISATRYLPSQGACDLCAAVVSPYLRSVSRS